MSKNKHLTLDDRIEIEASLARGDSFKAIGRALEKDCTTIAKEVKAHREVIRTGAIGKGFNDCAISHDHLCKMDHCCPRCLYPGHRYCWACGKCTAICPSYKKYICPKLEKAPYVCNGCAERNKCILEKRFYYAKTAEREYEALLSSSRAGIDCSDEELARLDDIVSPLLMRGQSLHHIAVNHRDETMTSERTLYKYVNAGLFHARNIDMPATVQRRPRKKKQDHYCKIDTRCTVDRTYNDYVAFIAEHPEMVTCEMDSVEGIKGGAVLLTLTFSVSGLQVAYLRESNDSQSVIDIFEKLYMEMGLDVFEMVFPILLTDNGSEFTNPEAIEYDRQGNQRTKVFYCDPQSPYQKPHCENRHVMLRRCLPKHVDIGQYTQELISLMMSHINSYARSGLGNKSPYDVFEYQYSADILEILGIRKIPSDEITLTPAVFKLQ